MKNFINISFLFFILSACNYEPIFSAKTSDFGISSFETINENRLTKKIKGSMNAYQDLSREKIYSLEVEAEKIKEVNTKDSKGNIKSYTMNIVCSIKINRNGRLIKSKKIAKSFIFDNNPNKFQLRKYENDIENSLINKIVEELISELYSI